MQPPVRRARDRRRWHRRAGGAPRVTGRPHRAPVTARRRRRPGRRPSGRRRAHHRRRTRPARPRRRAAGMTVYLVGAGPGDPGLLTLHGFAVLTRADVVVYDRLASPTLLDVVPEGAEL